MIALLKFTITIGILITVILVGIYYLLRIRNCHIWFWSYLKYQCSLGQYKDCKYIKHIIFCFVDHFEPKWEKPSKDSEIARVNAWHRDYPRLADQFRDSDGKCPQHTWFYPAEEYEYEYLEKLAELCRKEYGEIELHLHHDKDTSDGVRRKINEALNNYAKHGALGVDRVTGKIKYGFIHGNWALDNSDAHGINCGVNDEIDILNSTGCYADFTLPAAPSTCQTKKINSIYYAIDNPQKPKSHDTGIDVEVNKLVNKGLLIMQGILTLNWNNRKYGLLPRIENSEISSRNPATRDRINLWLKQNIHVKGRDEWVFVKVHCHGAQERDFDALLGKEAEKMFKNIERICKKENYRLHYVTARECYNIIKAAENGEVGDPNEYRNYIIKKNGEHIRESV